MFFWNRTRRVTNLISYAIFRNIPTFYSPFVDHDLFDFLMSIEERFFLDGKFHSDTILRAYPKAAHVPFENRSAPPVSSARFRKRFLLALMKYSMKNRKYFRECFRNEYAWPRMCYSLLKGPDRFLGRAQQMFYLMRLHKAAQDRTA